jgi:hypothetical protein
MEDSQLQQNNSPTARPLVAKTSDGLNLSVQTYGDVEDLLTQPTMSTRMQALNQKAQISLCPESGRAPFYDEPERFSRELGRLHQ